MAFVKDRLWLFAVLLLACAGTFLVVDHQRLDSPTMDEPFHALASAEYALAGTYWANLEHPPLMKLLAGLSLGWAGARPPHIPKPFSFRETEMPRSFCYSNSIPHRELFAAARRPFPPIFFLLVVIGGLVARFRAGPVAGVLVAAFLAFEPNLVAHAGVLHTDVPATLGFLATLTLAFVALERNSFGLWGATGVALGLSLATKFSAVLLGPALLLISLLATAMNFRNRKEDKAWLAPFYGAMLSFAVAGLVLLGVYHICMRSMSKEEAGQAARLFLASRATPQAQIENLARVSRLLPEAGHYLSGLTGIAMQNKLGGGVNYLMGKTSVNGFWNYFFIAFAVKSSAAMLVLFTFAFGLTLGKRMAPGFFISALLATAAYLYLSATGASYNIGFRHMLPATPLILISAVVLLFRTVPQRLAILVASGLALTQLVETAAIHPYEFSFFNVFSGGPQNGEFWLNDSNLDWGQDLERLARSLSGLGLKEEELTVAYFGGALPEAYLPKARTFFLGTWPVTPGTYAISSYLLHVGPEAMLFRGDANAARSFLELRRRVQHGGELVGHVGYSIRIYQLR